MAKFSHYLLTLAYLCLVSIACDQQALATEKKLSGYFLEQDNTATGIHKITVCPDAVRLDGIRSGFTCISKGPIWDVVIFRQDRKQYVQLPYTDWMKLNSMVVYGDRFGKNKPITESHVEDNGQKIVIYCFKSVTDSGNFGIFRSDGNKEQNSMRSVVRCMDWPADIHPSSIIGKFYGLPPLRGIPLQIVSGSNNSYTASGLHTGKVSKSSSIPASQFDLPAGLTKGRYTDHIFVSDQTQRTIMEFMGETAK